jgi:hypothetical protein
LESSLDGLLLFGYLLYANTAFVGFALLYRSKPWAKRYNEWAVRIRERFPRLFEREGTRNAQRNYLAVLILLRLCGIFLVVNGMYGLLHVVDRR